MVNLTPLEIRVTADTDQAEAGLRRVGTATDTASAKMQRGASGANNLGKSMQVTGAKSRAMRGNLQNTSFQLQDMVVQLQMGTKWTTVMGQQLPQLAGGFGAVGAAIGVVAAVGFAGLGLAMAALGEETKTLEERLDDLSEAVALYGQFSDTASLSTDKLSERFGAAGNEAQKVAAFLSDWARIEAVEEMDAAVAQLADDFGGLGGEMIQVTDQTRALAESILGAGVTEFSSELLATVSDLSSEFDISSQSAARLVDAMRGFSSAESVSDQVDAAAQLNRQFAAVFGTVENIPPELREVAKQAGLIALQAAEIEGNTEDAHAAFADLVSIVGSLGPAMSPALGAVQSLTAEFGSANKAASDLYGTMLQMAIVEQASTGGRGGAGPGGPMGAAELFEARTGGVHLGDFGASDDAGATGGGGGVNPLVGDLAALQEQLMTQEELLSTSYESQLETLRSAREQRLLTEQEFNEMSLDAERQYQESLGAMRTGYNGNALSQSSAFLGDMASALSSGNDKMLAISEKFAKAEAIVNSIRAYSQVAADPSLPWFAKIPAAIGVAAAISGFASSLGGGGGAGASGGGGGAVSPEASASNVTNINANIAPNANYQGSSVMELFEIINQASADGNTIRLRSV